MSYTSEAAVTALGLAASYARDVASLLDEDTDAPTPTARELAAITNSTLPLLAETQRILTYLADMTDRLDVPKTQDPIRAGFHANEARTQIGDLCERVDLLLDSLQLTAVTYEPAGDKS